MVKVNVQLSKKSGYSTNIGRAPLSLNVLFTLSQKQNLIKNVGVNFFENYVKHPPKIKYRFQIPVPATSARSIEECHFSRTHGRTDGQSDVLPSINFSVIKDPQVIDSGYTKC